MTKISKKEPVKGIAARSTTSAKPAKTASQDKIEKTAKRHSKVTSTLTGVKKKYIKDTQCKVTFRLPKEAASGAEKVTLVGDFNQWNYTESEMKKLKSGDFQLTLELPSNREYRFKYLIDSSKWENDWCADKYIPNPYGGDDSVVVI